MACSSSKSKLTTRVAFSWVHSRITGGARPASRASFQRFTHKHQRSPALSPANRHCGRGVTRSLPRSKEKSKKAWVMRAQTRCEPVSLGSVSQQPSLK